MNRTEPGFGKTLLEDLRRGDFSRTLQKDWKELKEFYLNKERKTKLEGMNRIQRWLYMLYWLIKSLFLKLVPTRRLLLVISILILFIGHQDSGENNSASTNIFVYFSGSIILFLLMLELKDKLVARNELEAGKRVQIALMPEESPTIEGWSVWLFTRPANDVGGDMIDYWTYCQSKHSFTIGDVAGKGLPAALLMAKLQSTLRAIAPDYESLEALGNKVNEIFYRDTMPKSFASMLYFQVKTESGKINLINAGHLLPLIIKGNDITALEKTSPALGIMPNVNYVEQTLELDKGDIFFVYSDGLTEAQDKWGNFFGEERLKNLLNKLGNYDVNQLGKRIVGEIDYFTGDAPTHDDISMIIIKRTA